nr:hypothetical protein [Tanacetum cinerariifolium]
MAKTINREAQSNSFISNNGGTKPITTGEGLTITTDTHHTLTIIPPSTQPQKTQQPRKPKRKDTQVPQPSDPIKNVPYEVIHKELRNSLVMVATTASSLEAEQDSGDTTAQTRFESVSKHSNDSLLPRGSLVEDASKQGRIDAIDIDEEITPVTVQDEVVSNDVDKEMFDVVVSDGEEVFVTEHEVAFKGVNVKVNVVDEVVEVIKTAKKIINAAQVSVAGDKVSVASVATTVSAATTTTARITNVGDITLAQALKKNKKYKTQGERD